MSTMRGPLLETLEWIDAKERLPEDADAKLVWCNDYRARLMVAAFFDKHWFARDEGLARRIATVTHWAEMPRGPR